MTVSRLAVVRRLQAAGAYPEDSELIFEGGARYAMTLVMLQELAEAHPLSRRSHRVFSLPGQVRRNETGDQFIINDLLYLVQGNSVVTVCILTPAQLDSLEQLEKRECPLTAIPLSTREQLMGAVHRAFEEAGPVSSLCAATTSVRTAWVPQLLSAPSSVNRKALKLPRWFLARGSVNLLIVPSYAVIRDQSLEIAQCTARWMRQELCRESPNFLWYDPTADMANTMIQKFRRTRCHPIAVELLEEPLGDERVTRSAYRLWKELFQGPAPTHGRLMVLATPSVAMSLMRLIMGQISPELSVDLSRPDFAKWGRRVITITGTMSNVGGVQFECKVKSMY